MLTNKSIVFFGTNATVTSGSGVSSTTLTENAQWTSLAGKGMSKANVLINFPTITTASNGTIIVQVLERFSGAGFVQTAYATARAYPQGSRLWITNAPATSDSNGTFTIVGYNPALGTGTDKQIIFTESSIQAISSDVYWIFYS